MAEKENVLKQTKSHFSFKGIVDGLGKQHAWNEDTIKKGKNKGKEFRSLKFSVQTSPVNKMQVELFGMELDYVYPYKKGEKGKAGESKKIEFSKRFKLPEGYNIIGINIGLEQDEKGKNIRKSLTDYDAAEYIHDYLEDGDSVQVSGEVVFSTYTNSEDEVIRQTKYVIKNIYKVKEIDFDAEGFEEESVFEQEIVFRGFDYDKNEDATYVDIYTIQYGNKFTPATLVIRPNGNEAIESMSEVFRNKKKVGFGDLMKVNGLALNKAETQLIEDDGVAPDKDDPFNDSYGEKPSTLEKRAVVTYRSELQITGIEKGTFVKELYTEDDFVVDDLVEEPTSKGESNDPFSESNGRPIDISEDDLPF